jgi:hypothetical protein
MSISPEQQKQKRSECFKENCQYMQKQCVRFHGYDCSRLGGNKIPTLMSLGYNTSIEGQGHSMKPKFVGESGGWTDEGR